MRIVIFVVLLGAIYIDSTFAQELSPLRVYEQILDDFAKASANNLNFQNGINVFIEKPENDVDALYQGFRITHTDGEYNGDWLILHAKDVVIQEEIPVYYRAILYLFKNKQYIVLVKKESENKYYFRIFNAVY